MVLLEVIDELLQNCFLAFNTSDELRVAVDVVEVSEMELKSQKNL